MKTGEFAWVVARRYLTARRKQAFISLISGVSVLGVAVGVAALLIALALTTGLQREMRDRIVSSAAHLYIYKLGAPWADTLEKDQAAILATPGVTGVAPAAIGKGLLKASGGGSEFVTIKGIDVKREPTVTSINDGMRAGSLDALLNRAADRDDGIILGADLATRLGAHVGDHLALITPDGPLTPYGQMTGRRNFEVVGTFQMGLYELDSTYALIDLRVALEFLRKAEPDLLQARVAQMFDAPKIGAAVAGRLGSLYSVENWTEMNKALYSALWIEKMAISLTIGLVVLVAALNIVASLVLLVMEKTRDIAILRTMGAPARAIRLIFMLQGLIIGVVGTFAGAVLGLGVSYLADRYHWLTLPGDVYQITHVPFRIEPLDVTLVLISAIVVCWIATIYPSRRAGQLDPAEALRYQ
ncbi:MAG: FtsX-like permease family protein [Acidobacteria bacterium]|nr:MAG: FtsX-like permease family protein [Acidobacteriota bacterium]